MILDACCIKLDVTARMRIDKTEGMFRRWVLRVSAQGVGIFPEVSTQRGEYSRGGGYSPHYCHLVAATKRCMVGKRAVHILLECFLLLCYFVLACIISICTHIHMYRI